MALDDRRGSTAHPDLERLAEYADGVLAASDRVEVERHLADCEECRSALAETMAFIQAEHAGGAHATTGRVELFRRQRLLTGVAAGLAAAAAVALAIRLTTPAWLGFGPRIDRSQFAELMAAVANEPARPFEGRVAGEVRYAPPPRPTRGARAREISPDLRIAAAKIEKLARERGAVDRDASLGVAYLATGEVDKAILVLENAGSGSAALSDLASAYLTRAASGDALRAVDASRRAIEQTPNERAAQFNYALSLERAGLVDEARSAWQAYLTLEADSAWAAEARTHLASLTRSSGREGQAPQPAGVGESRATLRESFEEDLFDRWAVAVLHHDAQQQQTAWTALVARGLALTDAIPDRLPGAALAAVRAHEGRSDLIARLARGHHNYAEGRRLFRDDNLAAAADAFRSAADQLTGLTPFAAWPALYIVATTPALQDAAVRLERLRHLAARNQYLAVLARAEWLIGNRATLASDPFGALSRYQHARTIFDQLGERQYTASLDASIAGSYLLLDDVNAVWSYQQRAVQSLPQIADERVRHVVLASSVGAATQLGLHGLATTFLDALIRRPNRWQPPTVVAEELVRRAVLLRQLGKPADARQDLARASDLVAAVATRSPQLTLGVDIAIEEAAFVTDPARRASLLGTLIADATRAGQIYRTPALRLARAEALRLDAQDAEATAELRRAVQAVEQRLDGLRDVQARMTSIDETWAFYVELIEAEARSGDGGASAFEIGERARLRGLLTAHPHLGTDAAAVQRGLGASTVLLSYLTLSDRTLLWIVTRRELTFLTLPVSSEQLATRIHTLVDGAAPDQAQALFDLLLRPAERFWRDAHHVVIVPDGPLAYLPFAALTDRRTGMIFADAVAISMAPSAALYAGLPQQASSPRSRRVLVVGDPAIAPALDVPLAPLPDSRAEAMTVGRMYSRTDVLLGRDATKARFQQLLDGAGLVHFAGHAINDDRFPALSHLVFAGDDGEAGDALYAYEIPTLRMASLRLAVLAACDTGSQMSVRHGEGAFGLAARFLDAGVPRVVATLWEIDDRASRTLFETFHAELAAGRSVASALRAAQRRARRLQDVPPGHALDWAAVVAIEINDERVSSGGPL